MPVRTHIVPIYSTRRPYTNDTLITEKKNYFEVTGLDQDNSQAVFTIACSSLKEKTGWLQTVTSTINTWNEKFKGQPQELPKRTWKYKILRRFSDTCF